jgi:hypothetical protein
MSLVGIHEKMIVGNHVLIAAEEMLDYIIEGISDSMLRDQAYIQCYNTTESLLEAFKNVTL